MEEQIEYLINLGEVLHKFYDGQILTGEELTLIASSSNDDKIRALNFNAARRLGMRQDRSFEAYTKNYTSLKLMRSSEKKR